MLAAATGGPTTGRDLEGNLWPAHAGAVFPILSYMFTSTPTPPPIPSRLLTTKIETLAPPCPALLGSRSDFASRTLESESLLNCSHQESYRPALASSESVPDSWPLLHHLCIQIKLPYTYCAHLFRWNQDSTSDVASSVFIILVLLGPALGTCGC